MFVSLDQVSRLHSAKSLDLIRKKPVLHIRIQDPVPFWPLDPGSGKGKKSGSGSGIRSRDEQPGSYFLELRNHFWVKYLNYLMRIRDPGWKKIGSGMEKSRIRDPG
jgi:hypothetical protein